MTTPPWPDVPSYPYPPERPTPERRDPIVVPMVYEPLEPIQQLYQRRTILLGGPLDAATATRVAAELMSLDTGRPVDLLINSTGGPVAEVFAVLDVIALLRGPVNTMCIGRAVGTAAAVLAAGTGRRRATPNATISLRCAEAAAVEGTATEVAHQSELLHAERARLAELLAAATGLPAERVDQELDAGTTSTAQEALELGVIDELATR